MEMYYYHYLIMVVSRWTIKWNNGKSKHYVAYLTIYYSLRVYSSSLIKIKTPMDSLQVILILLINLIVKIICSNNRSINHYVSYQKHAWISFTHIKEDKIKLFIYCIEKNII